MERVFYKITLVAFELHVRDLDIINEADLRRLKLDLCDPFELILYDLGA